ncbi:MAG: hypothetical protein ACRD2O_04460 [Terriglobia bacterium]
MTDSLEAERLVLESWKRERAELDAAIAVLEKKIATRSGSTLVLGGISGQIGPDEFFRLSTPEAIKKFLKIVGKPARSTTDIIDGLKAGGMDTNYTNVYTALMRLQKRGVAKVGDSWGLDEWYPPAPARDSRAQGESEAEEQAPQEQLIAELEPEKNGKEKP